MKPTFASAANGDTYGAIDSNRQMVDFRLTARRDAKAAKAFLNKAIERVRLHRPVTIVTDKTPAYRRVIREINHRYDPHFDSIRHIDRKRPMWIAMTT